MNAFGNRHIQYTTAVAMEIECDVLYVQHFRMKRRFGCTNIPRKYCVFVFK